MFCTQLSAFMPVTASMRRTPAAMPDSDTTLKNPMSPVALTCVPPQEFGGLADVEHAHDFTVAFAKEHHCTSLLASSIGSTRV